MRLRGFDHPCVFPYTAGYVASLWSEGGFKQNVVPIWPNGRVIYPSETFAALKMLAFTARIVHGVQFKVSEGIVKRCGMCTGNRWLRSCCNTQKYFIKQIPRPRWYCNWNAALVIVAIGMWSLLKRVLTMSLMLCGPVFCWIAQTSTIANTWCIVSSNCVALSEYLYDPGPNK